MGTFSFASFPLQILDPGLEPINLVPHGRDVRQQLLVRATGRFQLGPTTWRAWDQCYGFENICAKKKNWRFLFKVLLICKNLHHSIGF
jgi:hypothetical protein